MTSERFQVVECSSQYAAMSVNDSGSLDLCVKQSPFDDLPYCINDSVTESKEHNEERFENISIHSVQLCSMPQFFGTLFIINIKKLL